MKRISSRLLRLYPGKADGRFLAFVCRMDSRRGQMPSRCDTRVASRQVHATVAGLLVTPKPRTSLSVRGPISVATRFQFIRRVRPFSSSASEWAGRREGGLPTWSTGSNAVGEASMRLST